MNRKFKVKPDEIEVGHLRLHSEANRELRPTRVRKLVQTMNLDSLGRFAVWRDGRNLYVIDGQHRKVALEELGFADLRVLCDVYEGMTFADACEQFLNLNDSLTIVPFDRFDKSVKAGRMSAVETKRIVEEEIGLRVSQQAGDGRLACVQAATEVWNLDQGVALKRALTWSTEAWGMTAAAAEGQIVRGLGILAHRFNGEIDDASLITKLAKHPGGPAHLIGSAKSRRDIKGGTVGRNLAALVVDVYNRGRRSGQVGSI